MPVIQFRPALNRPSRDGAQAHLGADQARGMGSRGTVVPLRRPATPRREADISYADLINAPDALSRLSTLISA